MTPSRANLTILGMSRAATAFYTDLLEKKWAQNHNWPVNYHLINTNFDLINDHLPGPSAQLIALLTPYIGEYLTANHQHLLVPNITIHESLDQIEKEENTPLNLVHPYRLTAEKLRERKHQSAVLFGSRYTMNKRYPLTFFESVGCQVMSPTEADQAIIDQTRIEVYHRNQTRATEVNYLKTLEKYSAAQPVVVACTELSMVDHFNRPNIFDCADLQIEWLVEQMHSTNI